MRKPILCVLLLIAGCHDRRPPTPSPEQSEQLNEADNMLDSMARNEEGPETNDSGPSR